MEQKAAWKQRALIKCYHGTFDPVFASSLTTTPWWPMPTCSCWPHFPNNCACGNSSNITSTSAARQGWRTLGTGCCDAGRLRAGGRRLHRRRRSAARRWGCWCSRLRSQGFIHAGNPPAPLSLRPCPPARPGLWKRASQQVFISPEWSGSRSGYRAVVTHIASRTGKCLRGFCAIGRPLAPAMI